MSRQQLLKRKSIFGCGWGCGMGGWGEKRRGGGVGCLDVLGPYCGAVCLFLASSKCSTALGSILPLQFITYKKAELFLCLGSGKKDQATAETRRQTLHYCPLSFHSLIITLDILCLPFSIAVFGRCINKLLPCPSRCLKETVSKEEDHSPQSRCASWMPLTENYKTLLR